MFVSLSYQGGRQDWVTHFEAVTSSFLVSGLRAVLLLAGGNKTGAEAMCAGCRPTFFAANFFFAFGRVGPMVRDSCWSLNKHGFLPLPAG